MASISKNKEYKSSSDGFDALAFSKMMDDAYVRMGRESKFTQKKSFSPSGFYGSGQCPRFWYLAFEGSHFDNSNDAKSIANMDNGTDRHARIQAVMEETGKLVETEREILLADPPIRGFVDAIIEWEGEMVVGEIKTTRLEVFGYRASTMKGPGYQLIQLLIYMKVLGYKNGFLLYENKNTHEIVVVPVSMTKSNQKLIDDTFDWMRTVHKSWLDQELPKRVFEKKSSECKGCAVFEECSKLWDGTADIPALNLPK